MEQRPTQRSKYLSRRPVSFSQPDILEDEYDDDLPSRMPSSIRRYRSDVRSETAPAHADVRSLAQGHNLPNRSRKNAIPQRSTARPASQTHVPAQQPPRRRQEVMAVPVDTEDIITTRHYDDYGREPGYVRPRRLHWLFYIGLAMCIMLVGWLLLSFVLSWWQTTQDDWHYGRPRTFQTDAVVGHNDSSLNPSHFIALNLRRHVEIIECPGGDCSKAKIYAGPVLIGQGQDLAVVTLSFKDVNGDGRPDMIVSVQDSRFVFINDNGAFRPQRPGESIQLGS